ncbi:Hypothetical predicted protein [Mytilus galloprovincialis]|uniref:Fucolectin tachylectin-4 pentraxin-1 domain-containing protein n=1 Tax=Mytilus galloprovincialis TaxID=29158 RepID=A0A8B6CXS4_MYTGA|nr:Hypothetical predicted protein [Mytilus galloprovincialis]
MSSVYDPTINQNVKFLCCNSSYAVDGDKSVWTGRNLVFAHSIKKDDQHPWWAVDLQNVYDVNVINIYGRTDDFPEQRSNFVEVFMPACSFNILNSLYDGDEFQCPFQATASQHISTTCPNNTRGRFVRIKRRDTKVLVICEVEVYGDPVNSLIKTGRLRSAYACGYIRYRYAVPVIRTYVANSDVHCAIICLTNTACSATEYDKNTKICTLKGECIDGTHQEF